jgi:bacteriocin-like protein
MNRLINNEKMNQSNAAVELSDKDLEQVVGGCGDHECHPQPECDYGFRRHRCDNDLLSDLLELL